MTEQRVRTVHPREIPARRRPRLRGDAGRLRIGRLSLPHGAILIVILAIAAALRFAGIGWGDNHYFHPDERYMTMVTIDIVWPSSVSQYFDSETSPLNPFNTVHGSYVYGTLPLFLAKLVGTLTGDVVYGDAHLPGRWLSAVADVGIVALAFAIGRRMFSSRAGLIAAALVAFTPLHIQTAHFFTTDSVSAFFAVAVFAATLHAWHRRSWRWFVVAGLCVGFATASKPNLAITAGFLAVPALESVRLHGWRRLLPPWRWRASSRRDAIRFPVALGVALSAIAAALAFRVAQPYAFAGPNWWNVRLDTLWTDTLDYWRLVQAGQIDTPPGVQWADRAPVVFMLDNLVRWGMGPALGIAALISVAVVAVGMLVRRRWPSWWLLAIAVFALFHILFYGTGVVKTQRYLLPAYPFMIVLAAGQLDSLPSRFRGFTWRRRWPSRLARPASLRLPGQIQVGTLVTALVIAGTMFSGVALTTIYLKPHSRAEASEWIYENIPAGSVISSEHWDDGLPVSFPDYPVGQYVGVQLALYDADNDAKLARLIGQLHRVDYIVLSSDRLIGSIPRMPDRYPMTTAYYEALVSGELGFELVADFQSPPELFGIELDDRGAEEALTVYDHPYVRIFEKTDQWSTNDAWYLLDDALGDGGVARRMIDLPQSNLLFSEADWVAYANSGTWSDMFDPDGIANTLPAVWWYLILQLFALPAIPILWRLLPSLPDRGYALAKTIGVFGIAWIAWMLASLRLVEFGRLGIGLALWMALLTAAVVVGFRVRPMLADLRQRWRWIAATEALFLVSFAAIVWLRALNPDLWQPGRGGEKPMELAIFNAILRSPWFPPFDPWFAGGSLHYYYFGCVPWAAITRLTGILPEIAFNLALPSVFAMLLLNVWIAAAALISRMRRPDVIDEADARAGMRWRPILLALAAPVFVGILGNLDFVRRIGRGEWGYSPPPSWLEPFGDAGRIGWGTWNTLTESVALPTTAFWDPTRVIPNTINEFPYFSLLFGDLHAHVLAMPVVAAVIVVAISLATVSESRESTRDEALLGSLGGWRRIVPMAVLGGFLTGILYSTNTWDYPPSMALLAAAAAICVVVRRGVTAPWQSLRDVMIFAAIVFLSGRMLFQPYISQYGSIPSQSSPAVETTRLADYLTIHGVVLWAIAGYLAIELGRVLLMLWRQSSRWGLAAIVLALALYGGYGTAFVIGNTSLFLIVGLVTLVVCVCGRLHQPQHLFVFAMIGLAFVLALIPERFRLENDIGRMNLVFKFYLHAWQLLGISAAVAVVQVVSAVYRAAVPLLASDREAEMAGSASTPYGPHLSPSATGIVASTEAAQVSRARLSGRSIAGIAAGRVWMTALVVLVIGALSYPVLVTGPRLDDRFNSLDPTLDGLAYMDEAVWAAGPEGGESTTFPLANDREAIAWLRQNIDGSPVILEAQTPAYQWGGRISSTTGLPTVLGWTWHQIQQRPGYGEQVNQRVADVQEVYGGSGTFASIEPILDRYHVELIYIGDLERALYGEQGLAKFSDAAENGDLEVVYEETGVVIYAWPEGDATIARDPAG